MICDCSFDCDDGSDEIDCKNCTVINNACKEPYFNCGDKQQLCIPRFLLCDGIKDCPSGSDENSATCGEMQMN